MHTDLEDVTALHIHVLPEGVHGLGERTALDRSFLPHNLIAESKTELGHVGLLLGYDTRTGLQGCIRGSASPTSLDVDHLNSFTPCA